MRKITNSNLSITVAVLRKKYLIFILGERSAKTHAQVRELKLIQSKADIEWATITIKANKIDKHQQPEKAEFV